MDDNQVRALRHKRHIVASNVQLDENTTTELTKRKLINRAILDNLKVRMATIIVETFYFCV